MKHYEKYDYYKIHANNKQGWKTVKVKKDSFFCVWCGKSNCEHKRKFETFVNEENWDRIDISNFDDEDIKEIEEEIKNNGQIKGRRI